MRYWIAKQLIVMGVAMLPRETRELVRDILMFHVPGAVPDERKALIVAMNAERKARINLGE